MKKINYERPQLLMLDTVSSCHGSCTVGSNFQCKTGISFNSGTTCDAGQWANVDCISGTTVGGNRCGDGSFAVTKCNNGTTNTGGICKAGNTAAGTCNTGSVVT